MSVPERYLEPPTPPGTLVVIGQHLSDRQREGFLAALHSDGPPAVVVIRHRYVRGTISVKCDFDSAVYAFRLYGGRVDRSTVVAYEDGEDHLGSWEQVWPPLPQGDVQPDGER